MTVPDPVMIDDDDDDATQAPNPPLEIDETEASDEAITETLRFEISSYPADYTVKGLVDKWERNELILPEFQRGYVWKLPKASKLVESFLIGLPVPQIFLYKDRASGKLKVIDGHQRLATLAKFYREQFSDSRIFRLKGVHAPWEGKRYSDLEERDRLQLDDSPLRSIVVQQLAPDDHESIYLIFERLNAGGVNLMPMEIRKSVFHGQAYELVADLNNLPEWRSLIGQPLPDDRLRDVELVLRVLALADQWPRYAKPMKTFITKYMDELAKAEPGQVEALKARFTASARATAVALGERPFHLRGRLNVAALDSVLGGVIRSDTTDVETISRCYRDLKTTNGWTDHVYVSTSDVTVVRARFQAVESCLRPPR